MSQRKAAQRVGRADAYTTLPPRLIALLRKTVGLRQSDVARALAFSPATVYNWESGLYQMGPDAAEAYLNLILSASLARDEFFGAIGGLISTLEKAHGKAA